MGIGFVPGGELVVGFGFDGAEVAGNEGEDASDAGSGVCRKSG